MIKQVLDAVLRSARLAKVLPLVLVLLDAALLTGKRLDGPACGLAAAFTLVISTFGTRVNVLADVELDRARKPELAASLRRWPHATPVILSIELTASVVLLAASSRRSGALAVGLGVYGAAFLLYSFNFVTFWRAWENRLKVFWWGNALAVTTGYAALWVAGFACAGVSVLRAPTYFAVAIGAALVDYGVFLAECAGDAAEERAHGLRTLPAMLGAPGAAGVGLAVLMVGGATILACVLAGAPPAPAPLERTRAVALAFYSTVQLAGCLGALSLAFGRRRRAWDAVVDSSFWISRGGMLLLVLGLVP